MTPDDKRKLDEIHTALVGNMESPGLISRVKTVETSVASLQRKVLLVTGGGLTLYGFYEILPTLGRIVFNR